MRELDEVHSLLDQGLSSEAKDRLTSVISSARNHPSVLALARCALSTALEMQGHYRDSLAAVAMYESPESRAKLDDKTVSFLRVQIGLAYNYNGDHPKAVAMLKSTLRDYSENGATNLGHIYAALSRTYRSISEYPIARDYAERALENFRQAVTSDPDLAEGHYNLGLALAQTGHVDESIPEFTEAISLNPVYIEARMNLGLALSQKNDLTGAANVFRDLIKRHPDSAESHNNLGLVLLQGKDPLAAQSAFRAALRLKPGYAEAHYNLGLALRQAGQPAESQSEMEKAYQLAPQLRNISPNLE